MMIFADDSYDDNDDDDNEIGDDDCDNNDADDCNDNGDDVLSLIIVDHDNNFDGKR